MDFQILRRLQTTITWYALELPIRDDGKKTFAEGVNIYCYVDGRMKRIISGAGDEVVSVASLILSGSDNVSYMDEVLLNGRRYPVRAVSTYPSLRTGNELIEVFL